jgi:hypothetical protein
MQRERAEREKLETDRVQRRILLSMIDNACYLNK